MTIRAKFKVVGVTQTTDTARINLNPVICGSPENESFYRYTPGGHIDLQVVDPATAARFTEGAEFYVDFTPVAAATLDLASDAPLAPACDLSGDKTCEACQ